jgi:hypothetical protein
MIGDAADQLDSDSDAPGHEDKRAHPNDKAGTVSGSGRRGGRKSVGEGGKEGNKAARRKEQNRAAQKAFRERREAKVKDVSESDSCRTCFMLKLRSSKIRSLPWSQSHKALWRRMRTYEAY